jgi:hypothetical protein
MHSLVQILQGQKIWHKSIFQTYYDQDLNVYAMTKSETRVILLAFHNKRCSSREHVFQY